MTAKWFTSSDLSCPMQMALSYLGFEKTIPERMKKIFEIGHEFDQAMKEEAEEEWDDFYAPRSHKLAILKRGNTRALVKYTPDGIRDDSIVEFKGLSPTNWNTLRDSNDLIGPDTTPLFRKYGRQVEMYAHLEDKEWIVFRAKNKRNLSNKTITYRASPKRYREIKNMILDVKELIDNGDLPDCTCKGYERKSCFYKKSCATARAEWFENRKSENPTREAEQQLENLKEAFSELYKEIKESEEKKEAVSREIKRLMRQFGQREWEGIKYGFRWKQYKDKDVIEKLVQEGKIPVTDAPEEYLSVAQEEL